MRDRKRRLLRCAAALSPTALFLAVPALGTIEASAFGGPAGIAAAASLGLILSLRGARRGDRGPGLLRTGIDRDLPHDLPRADTRRARIASRLAGTSLRRDLPPDFPVGHAPEHPDDAIAHVLSSVMREWQVRSLAELGEPHVLELFLLDRLLTASPGDAGRIAPMFRHPDRVLSIRDGIRAVAADRERFDTQFAILNATATLWERQEAFAPETTDPIARLQALPVPDPDLWHHVVLNHDSNDAAQARAALWAAEQPEADMATIAALLADVAICERLTKAIRVNDRATIDSVFRIVGQWNAGRYSEAEIGLTPPDAVLGCAPLLAAELGRAAEHLGVPRPADPRGLFIEYHGRAVRDRSHWDLRTGRLRRAPSSIDYFDSELIGLG